MGFDEKDFNSDDGIVTFIWGPSMWNFLHMMSFQYPVKPSDTDKKKYKAFILYSIYAAVISVYFITLSVLYGLVFLTDVVVENTITITKSLISLFCLHIH